MRTRLIAAVLFAFGIAGLSACANTDTETTNPDDGEMASSGMALTSDILADTDVSRMRFRIRPANCTTGNPTGPAQTKVKDLSDMMLPGGIAKFENAPFDEDSQHLFADAFFLVDAGCYNVVTTPLDNVGNPSSDCNPATRDRVAVEDGQTTEILLINQCRGEERGGLDVISAINNPPVVEDLEFQKFRTSCPTQAEQICLTASDPNSDPLEFVWRNAGGGQFQGDIVESSRTNLGQGQWRSCAQVATNRIGDYEFEVTVYDLDGQGNRMEELLAEQGNPAQSRDSIRFPIYSGVNCQGRRATILMAIGDDQSLIGPNDFQQAQQLIRQTARWASPLTDKDATDVLYVLDDNNRGEHMPQDRQNVTDALDDAFDDVDEIVEPAGGLDNSDVAGYDLVWFANPGWPMDDVSTRDVLRNFSQDGGGVVLEGNDMGRHAAAVNGLQYFTGLNFINNGTTTCGVTTDNYSGNPYRVEISTEPHPTIDGLLGTQISYDNDIDHVSRLLVGEQVHADARFSRGDCSYRGPAMTTRNGLNP